MFLPGIEMIRLFFLRIIKLKSPFDADNFHLHHLLLKMVENGRFVRQTSFGTPMSVSHAVFCVKRSQWFFCVKRSQWDPTGPERYTFARNGRYSTISNGYVHMPRATRLKLGVQF